MAAITGESPRAELQNYITGRGREVIKRPVKTSIPHPRAPGRDPVAAVVQRPEVAQRVAVALPRRRLIARHLGFGSIVALYSRFIHFIPDLLIDSVPLFLK